MNDKTKDINIKGNGNGIILEILNNDDFNSTKKNILRKLKKNEKFYSSMENVGVSFVGLSLTDEEKNTIIDEISKKCAFKAYLFVNDNKNDETYEKESPALNESGTEDVSNEYNESFPVIKEGPKNNLKLEGFENLGRFYKGTLRSGQQLESDCGVVILGDVNPGASIIASGSVVILGALRGTVYAGCKGNSNSFVAALDMNPVQIRIADCIGRSNDGKIKLTRSTDPKIAFVDNGGIYIEKISKEVLKDLSF